MHQLAVAKTAEKIMIMKIITYRVVVEQIRNKEVVKLLV